MAASELRRPGVMNVQECSWGEWDLGEWDLGEWDLGGDRIRPETRPFWHWFMRGEAAQVCFWDAVTLPPQLGHQGDSAGFPGFPVTSGAVLSGIWGFATPPQGADIFLCLHHALPFRPREVSSETSPTPSRNAEMHLCGDGFRVEFGCSLHVCADISCYLDIIAHVNVSVYAWSHLHALKIRNFWNSCPLTIQKSAMLLSAVTRRECFISSAASGCLLISSFASSLLYLWQSWKDIQYVR